MLKAVYYLQEGAIKWKNLIDWLICREINCLIEYLERFGSVSEDVCFIDPG